VSGRRPSTVPLRAFEQWGKSEVFPLLTTRGLAASLGRRPQMKSDRSLRMAPFGLAPMMLFTGLPPWNTVIVGMDMTW
jgi:hypothetical protein